MRSFSWLRERSASAERRLPPLAADVERATALFESDRTPGDRGSAGVAHQRHFPSLSLSTRRDVDPNARNHPADSTAYLRF
jgi:hypothetical protein